MYIQSIEQVDLFTYRNMGISMNNSTIMEHRSLSPMYIPHRREIEKQNAKYTGFILNMREEGIEG